LDAGPPRGPEGRAVYHLTVKALILAGGRGTRLQPYTTIIPKPLMPVGAQPILEILLRQLHAAGIRELVLAVGYLSPLLRAYFGDGRRWNLKIRYVEETEPLGTAGCIGLALPHLGKDFLMMNGDLLTTMDFGALLRHHRQARAAATIGIHQREVKIDFGVIAVDAGGLLKSYEEKPVLHYQVSMGVYVINRRSVESYVNPVRRLDAPELMQKLIAAKRRVSCFQQKCYWLDIGRPDDYRLANEIVESGQFKFPSQSPE
jgi:NDP-sugar pyrophosphorylase family protein